MVRLLTITMVTYITSKKLLPLPETASLYQDTSLQAEVVVETVVLLWVTLISLPSKHVTLILRGIAGGGKHLMILYSDHHNTVTFVSRLLCSPTVSAEQ